MAPWGRAIARADGRRVITILGGVYVVLAMWRAARLAASGEPVAEAVVELVLLVVPGTTILYGGYRLPHMELRPEAYPRIVAWTFGGFGLMLAVIALLVLNPGGSVDRPVRAATLATALGSVAGFAIGLHEAWAVSRAQEAERHRFDLRRERDLRERIVETSPVGIVVVNADRSIRLANQRAADIVGLPREEILELEYDESMLETTGAEGNLLEEGVFSQVLDTGRAVYDAERKMTRPDGQRIWLSVNGAPLRDPSSDVIAVIFAFEEITQRKEYERKLEESEQRYRTLTEHFPSGVVGVFDHDLQYTLVEGAILDELGLGPADLEGRPVQEFFPPETAGDIVPMFRAAIVEGESDSALARFAGRTFRVWATPLRDASGDIFAGLSFAQDVTDQVEREQQLEASNERLAQFAHAASHDLQEPLRMVSSYLQLLERRYADELDEDAREFIGFAVDGADRMRAMIDSLLEYSHITSDGPIMEPTDAQTVLDTVLEDLQLRIEETGATITADELPTVTADRNQLAQVFRNLLSNALRYSGRDRPRVHVGVERVDDRWRFSVADEGIGIDQKYHDRVFEVFESVHTDEEGSGSGLGLALCQQIIERHGGDIWVESAADEGATFYFTLPVIEEGQRPAHVGRGLPRSERTGRQAE